MDATELAGVLDAIGDGVYVVDLDRRITFWNTGAERISGHSRGDAVGRWCGDGLLDHVDDTGMSICAGRCPLQDTMRDGRRRECRVFLHHRDGSMVPVRVAATPVRDADGAITGAVEVFVDDADRVRAQRHVERLTALALVDTLTGLGNRAFLERSLEARIATMGSDDEHFGLLFVDIDHFKAVNDTYGHAVGDDVLRVVASTLTRNQRAGDEVARFGGEEFVVVTGPIRPDDLLGVAERLRGLVAASRVDHERGAISVTVSIGAAVAIAQDTAATLLERADQRLLTAKRSGRDQVVGASHEACGGRAT